jgi:hypothetical protein
MIRWSEDYQSNRDSRDPVDDILNDLGVDYISCENIVRPSFDETTIASGCPIAPLIVPAELIM